MLRSIIANQFWTSKCLKISMLRLCTALAQRNFKSCFPESNSQTAQLRALTKSGRSTRCRKAKDNHEEDKEEKALTRLPLRSQQPPDHFAGRGHRHFVDEGDLARILVRRQMCAHEPLDVVGKRIRLGLSGFQHDERLDDLG